MQNLKMCKYLFQKDKQKQKYAKFKNVQISFKKDNKNKNAKMCKIEIVCKKIDFKVISFN